MYVANAWKQTKRGKKDDSSAVNLGAPKTSGGFKTAQELKAMGERYGWVAGPVSPDDVKAWGADQLRWNELFNKEALEHALTLPERIKHGKEVDQQWQAKKFWDNAASIPPQEHKAMLTEFKKFVDHYPQYKSTTHWDDNNDALFGWLQDRHMAPIYSNLVLAFEANALAGKVWLNPNAINAGSETEVSGQDLLRHHSFHLLIQAQRRVSDLDCLSANEFLAQHDELKDKRTPPLVAAREARAEATAAHFANAETNTAKSGSTNVVDYPQVQRGVPAQPDKVSFRKKVQNMTSEEIRRECEIDQSFKDALDQLQWK
jgi:hypothetical protein